MRTGIDHRVGALLRVWVRGSQRFAAAVVLAFVLATAGSLYYAAGHLGINTDTTDMISEQVAWRRAFIDYRETFPQYYRTILVLIEATTPEQADLVRDRLYASLREAPHLYPSILRPGGEPFFARNGLLYLSLDELEALADNLSDAQPLLGRLSSQLGLQTLLEMLAAVLVSEPDLAEPRINALLRALNSAFDTSTEGRPRRVSWQRLVGTDTSEAGTERRFLLLKPHLDFSGIRPAKAAIEDLRVRIAVLNRESPAVSIKLTGSVMLEHEELESVTRGASLAGLLALLMVAGILYAAFRSLAVLAVSIGTLLAGLSGTAAFAALAVGHLNLISVAFAVLYIGLGIDFVIHFCLRYRELLAAGSEPHEALPATAGDVGTSLLICTVTTAAGFYAFVPTPFEGVGELGLISGTGMVISLFTTLTLLPALLALLGKRIRPVARARESRAAGVLESLLARRRVLFAAAIVVAAISTILLPGLRFDNNPVHLRDPESESVRTFETLLENPDLSPLRLVVIAPDPEAARALSIRLSELPLVHRVIGLHTLIPLQQEEKLWVIDDLLTLIGPSLAVRYDDAETDQSRLAALRAFQEQLRVAAARGGNRQLDDLEAALSRFLARLDTQPQTAQAQSLKDLSTSLLGNLPLMLQRLDELLQAEAVGEASLPRELVTQWQSPDGRQLLTIFPTENLNDNLASERFVREVRGAAPNATGLPAVYLGAGETVLRAFQLAFVYALIMVTVLLLVFLSSVADTLRVLAPIVLAALMTAAATVVFDLPVNFANIIALPLLLGIGVDNGIHMVHRARTGLPGGGGLLRTSTARAVLFSGLTTMCSFGNLAFSPHLGMASMGQVLILGMAMMLINTLILIPALVATRR